MRRPFGRPSVDSRQRGGARPPMASSTYVARTPASFSALLQTAEIGGLRLQPFAPVTVRDEFYDTPTGDLLAEGLMLRVREQGGARTASLRRLREDAGGDLPDDVRFEDTNDHRLVPPGPFAEALRERVGSAPLGRVLALRQKRTARVGMDGGRPVALFSFDVVVYDLPGEPYVTNEVEVEPLGEATEAEIQTVHDDVVARGLVPEAASKYERGLVRLPRSLRHAILLTPDERDALEQVARTGSPLLQRRARVVLLDARGLRPDTIAAQTGLSTARVRHWRLRFREERLGILAEGDRGRPPAPASEQGRAEASASPPAPGADSASPSREPSGSAAETAAPDAQAPASAPADPPPAAEPPTPSGDGATPEPPEPELADLLDLFSPGETGTPLLDEHGAPEAVETRAGIATAPSPRAAFPVVLGPVPVRPARPAPRDTASAAPPRRPALTGATPLVEAAQKTLAYHVAAFEAAVDRLHDGRTVADARRVLITAHRVRLGAETFRALLPEAAVARLLGALRPIVADLDAALDADRAASEAGSLSRDALAARRDAALASALARLGPDRHQTWGARARRLLARLDAQRADDVLLGDDLLPPPDDFVGEPGDVPGPTRLRHILASLLWARYEAVRAFEGDLQREGPPASDLAYHFAIAVSALHFALGLAQASGGPVREVADALELAERDALALRNEQRTAELMAGEGHEGASAADAAPLREIWRALASPGFRARLAAVSARV